MTTQARWRHATDLRVAIITHSAPTRRSLTNLDAIGIDPLSRAPLPDHAFTYRIVILPSRPFTALARERAFTTSRPAATRLVPRSAKQPTYDGVFDGTSPQPGLLVWGLISMAFICAVVAVAYWASSGVTLL